jgi:CRISPR/Cas system-associated exonuclease Cas4 (RecB family)
LIRDRITATQLADFWHCPRKARYTDRLPPDRRNPDHPVRRRILEEGNAHEARIIASMPGVVALDSRRDGFEAVFAETRRLMALGVPAIHHGALLKREGSFTWLAEPDLLENTGNHGPSGHPVYRVVEIKNSPVVHSAHAVQLALNAWILESLQESPAEHHLIDHEGRRTPVRMDEIASLMTRLRGDCVKALVMEESPPYVRCPACMVCDWSNACVEDAVAQDAIGRLPGLGAREIDVLRRSGIPTLSALANAEGSRLFPDFPGFGEASVSKARALHRGVEEILDPRPPLAPEGCWLLHLERDVAMSKRLCLFSGQRFDGSGFFFHVGPETESAVRSFFSASPAPVFWTTTRHALSALRDGFLVRQALGDPRLIHEVRSLEGHVSSCRALPFDPAPLRRLLVHYGLTDRLLPESLETFYAGERAPLESQTRCLLDAGVRLPARLREATP